MSSSPPAPWVAYPLVVVMENGLLHVPEATLGALQSIQHAPSVHTLGVFGPRHTNKRVLLRTLLHAPSEAFAPPVLGAAESHVLLWLWLQHSDQAHEPARMVLTSDAHQDEVDRDRQRRIALLLLLSSTVFYNEEGEINSAALERLSWLRDVASSLRIKPSQDEGVAQSFHEHAPQLVWLVRNSKIKWLVDRETGEKITASEYLEQCFQDESGFSEAVTARNTMRMYWNQLFPRRSCIALTRTMEDASVEAALTTAREELRGPFVESVDAIYASYLSPKAVSNTQHLLPKSILSRTLEGDQFPLVLQTYVDAINRNALPTMQVAMHAVSERSLTQTVATARTVYDTALTKVMAVVETLDRVVGARDLRAMHLYGMEAAMLRVQQLYSTLPETMKKTIYVEQTEALRSQLDQQLRTLTGANQHKSDQQCEALVHTVLPTTLEVMAQELATRSHESFCDGLVALLTDYKTDLHAAVATYKARAAETTVNVAVDGSDTTKGDGHSPALYKCLERALLASVLESIKTWGATVLRQYQNHMRVLQQELTTVWNDLEVVRALDTTTAFSMEDHKRLYEEQVHVATTQLSEVRSGLQHELHRKQTELERILHEMTTMDLQHDVRVKSRESDLTWVRARTVEYEKTLVQQREQLQQHVSGATEEMLLQTRGFHQEERSLLAQQRELLARIVELERALVQKKTKHVQQVFTRETAMARQMEEVKQEQAEFARQLKSQAKTDTGVLKLAYQKKKNAVQVEIDRFQREIEEYQSKLAVYEPKSQSQSRTNTMSTAREKATYGEVATATATAVKASETTGEGRTDTELCKTQ